MINTCKFKKYNNMKISIIAPVYNEEDNLKMLYSAIKETLGKTNYDFEIIFVNDGSTDSSENVLLELTKDPKVKVVNFRKNYGQTAAIAAGARAIVAARTNEARKMSEVFMILLLVS